MDPSAAIGPVTEIVKCATVPAARHLGYMFHSKKNVDDLKSKIDNYLVPLEADVKTHVQLALKRGDEVYQTVKKWLENSENAKAEASRLYDEALQLTGWSSQSYRLGKEAEKKIVDVREMLKDGRDLLNKPISFYGTYQSVPAEGFDGFESRQSVKLQILEALKNDQVSIIGVCGMGGVGKTTLMKQILEQTKEEKLFDEVIMATVSQPPKLIEIQSELAEQLGMNLTETSIQTRAARLFKRLTEGKILVLLDDVWKELNLLEVGIPHGKTSHGCRVVITTRNSAVCNHMEVQASIEVKVLSKEDSWALFQRNAGDYINVGVSEQVANEIVDECKGLPLAIVTLAKSLRNKSLDIWVSASKQLKRSSFAGMSPVVTCIKYSYDNLETKERKLCFLLFCLYPEDARIQIENLLGYIMGEEIFSDVEALGELRDHLVAEIDQLVSSSLLSKSMDDFGKEYVTVHDIARDVGISLAENNGFIIKAGLGITEWPITKTCIFWMSLMKNNISELKDTPACPQLTLLSLAYNESLANISNGFFEGMKELVTLDLSRTAFSSLPQSISFPVSYLRTLLLNKCRNLKDISGIGSLTQLEILDLSGCDLRRLPEEMKSLTKLKLLNLSSNKDLMVIPLNAISSLTLLEEFYMFESFSHWNIEGEANRNNASFSELLSLPRLSTLHVRTNQDSLVHMDYPHKLKKLSKFTINLCSLWVKESNYSKTLTMKVNDHKPVNERVKALWEVSDELILENSHTMEAIFTYGDASLRMLKVLKVVYCGLINFPSELIVNLHNLKSIVISSCYNLKAINSEGDVRQLKVMCDNLEKINLIDLLSLEKIWKGSVSFESIQNLKEVNVRYCPILSYLFPISMAKSLQLLEILYIESCYKIVQIFGSEEEEVNEIISGPKPSRIITLLPRLKTLYIYKTKLASLDISFPSLEKLGIWNCDRLEEVFNSESIKEEDYASLLFPLLIKIDLYYLPKLTAIWKGFIPVRSFQNLKEVEIKGCESLSCIFPISTVMSLQQLEILKIGYCNEMVHIFDSDEEEKEDRETREKSSEIVDTNCCMIEIFWSRRKRRGQEPSAIGDNNVGKPPLIKAVLPRLKNLRLHFLDKLIGFCQQSSVVFYFPSLEELEIKACYDLKKLPFDPNSTLKLKVFEASNYWFYRLQWDDQST